MSEKITEIVVVLDKSGSMGSLRDDTIGGFNTLIEDQKKNQSTKCLVTLVQFDNQYEVNYMSKPIEEVEPLNHETYQPRGGTALHDAIGKTINGITDRHLSMDEEARPGQVMFVIITDGHENQSKEFRNVAPGMIKTQQEKHDWDFVYLGAGIDEVKIAREYNLSVNTVSSYNSTSRGVGSTYSNVSKLMNESRDMYDPKSRRRLSKTANEMDWKADIDGTQAVMEDEDHGNSGDS